MAQQSPPLWLSAGLTPFLQLLLALFASSLVVLFVGESPWEAIQVMVRGATNADFGIASTLYYATNFIFTGLAVALAFHAGMFNIGGEGQAAFAGFGVAVTVIALDPYFNVWLIAPVCVLAAAASGALWGMIPGWLQAYRGSHLVVTTMMFNFIAFSLVNWAMSEAFSTPSTLATESRYWADSAALPQAHESLRWLQSFGLFSDISLPRVRLSLAFFVALFAALAVWLLLWKTRLGYAIRALGFNPRAVDYAGIPRARVVFIAVLISGALAGMMAFNEVYGAERRLIQNFTSGYGFIGIGVALMGRNHPFGVVVAGLLFGALYQGGTELQLDMPTLSPQLILVIQGLVIFFTASTDRLLRSPIERLYWHMKTRGDQ